MCFFAKLFFFLTVRCDILTYVWNDNRDHERGGKNMWKDKLKGVINEAYKELEDAYEDVQEKVDNSKIFDQIKEMGETVLEEVEKANIGEQIKSAGQGIKKAGEEINERFMQAETGGTKDGTD